MIRISAGIAAIFFATSGVASEQQEYVVRYTPSDGICSVVRTDALKIGQELVGAANLATACEQARRKHKPEKTEPCSGYLPDSHAICKTVQIELPTRSPAP